MRTGFLFVIIVSIILCATTAYAYDWTTNPGDGSAADPYQIFTPEELMSIGSNPALLDKHFILTNDIIFDPDNNPAHVFTESLITPISSYSGPFFSGTLNGNGHQIVNLHISSDSFHVGLIGYVRGTSPDDILVWDLTLVNPTISGPYHSGSLAGMTELCTVRNCHVVGGSVNRIDGVWMGGLVGGSFYSITDHCTSSADVSGYLGVGGLVGTTNSASIYHSSASGNVSGTDAMIGGLLGDAYVWLEPELLPNPEVVHCFATGDVHSDVGKVGGLIGNACVGLIQNCFATGLVTGGSELGGLIGCFEGEGIGPKIVSGCFATGIVQGQANSIGGLIGDCRRIFVQDCYAMGDTSSASGSYVGGLIGSGGYKAVRCYSTGTASGTSDVGGLFGESYSDRTYLCCWDRDTSGTTVSADGIDKSTAEMMSRDTFKGWGDDVWVLDDGHDYPHLVWEQAAGEPIVDEKPYGGAGTSGDPYRIATVDDLIALGFYTQDWDKSFELVDDIILDPANLNDPNVSYDNANFNKIGFSGVPFTGYFNGNFHSISGFRNENVDEYENGLFGRIQGDGPDDIVVENLIIRDARFAGGSSHGGLAGSLNDCKVIRCGVEDTILTVSLSYNSGGNFGGLAGSARNSTITQCYVNNGRLNLKKSGFENGGGLVGSISDSWIDNSYAICDFEIQSSNWIGGLIGDSWDSDIYYCYTVPSVNEYYYINEIMGGDRNTNLRGFFYSSSITGWVKNSWWDYVSRAGDGDNDFWRLCMDGVGRPYLSWEFAKDGDFSCGDGVDVADLEALADAWLLSEMADPTVFSYAVDANGDGVINLDDLAVLGANWE
jgi:hypothetical protein